MFCPFCVTYSSSSLPHPPWTWILYFLKCTFSSINLRILDLHNKRPKKYSFDVFGLKFCLYPYMPCYCCPRRHLLNYLIWIAWPCTLKIGLVDHWCWTLGRAPDLRSWRHLTNSGEQKLLTSVHGVTWQIQVNKNDWPPFMGSCEKFR